MSIRRYMDILNEANRMLAPDIGAIFTYKDKEFRVTGWAKVAKDEPDSDFDDPLDAIERSSHRPLGPRHEKLAFCDRKNAEYVIGKGVSGTIAPVEGIVIVGNTNNQQQTDMARRWAMTQIGKPIG